MSLFKPEFGLIFWMLVIFLIILAILAKYAWPVIIKSLEERAAFIDSGVKYTEEAKLKLEEAEENTRALLVQAHKQQLAILQETERMKQGIIEDAKKAASVEAQKVMDAAQLSIEQSRKESELQMRRQVSQLSLNIAEKLLRKDLESDPEQQALVERMLDEMNA